MLYWPTIWPALLMAEGLGAAGCLSSQGVVDGGEGIDGHDTAFLSLSHESAGRGQTCRSWVAQHVPSRKSACRTSIGAPHFLDSSAATMTSMPTAIRHGVRGDRR